MRRPGTVRRRTTGVLVAGGLSVATLLGAGGVASAAGSFSVTGSGPVKQTPM